MYAIRSYYGVELITILALLQAAFFAARVGKARADYGIKAPAVSGHEMFERYFNLFSPNPAPRGDGSASAPNENVSPFAGAVVRFSKPVDLSTVRWADSFFNFV